MPISKLMTEVLTSSVRRFPTELLPEMFGLKRWRGADTKVLSGKLRLAVSFAWYVGDWAELGRQVLFNFWYLQNASFHSFRYDACMEPVQAGDRQTVVCEMRQVGNSSYGE
jgi:hypothetical protein